MLSQFYPPLIGGEEHVARHMANALTQRGHDVMVATMAVDGQPDEEIIDGVTIVRMQGTIPRLSFFYSDSGRRHLPPVPDPEVTLALRRLVTRFQPDIVHAHNWIIHAYLPLKKLSNAKLVLSLHDYSLTCATKKLIQNDDMFDIPCSGPELGKCLACTKIHYGRAKGAITFAANWAMQQAERRLVDLFLPVSYATAAGNDLIDSGLPYEILPNAWDDTVMDAESVRPYLEQLPSGPFIMFAGAAGAYKGVSILLDAYEQLKTDVPLVLIGYQTAEAGEGRGLPPNVHTFSNWPHEAVLAAWERCTVAVAPSRSPETFGLVVLEAMLAGRPVVASRIGALPELIINGETGLLVPPGDASSLAQSISRLLANPDLGDALGCAGRAHVQQFHSDHVIPRLEALYGALRDPTGH